MIACDSATLPRALPISLRKLSPADRLVWREQYAADCSEVCQYLADNGIFGYWYTPPAVEDRYKCPGGINHQSHSRFNLKPTPPAINLHPASDQLVVFPLPIDLGRAQRFHFSDPATRAAFLIYVQQLMRGE